MAKLPAEIPVLLCPLRVETRFMDNALWIRVFPDDFLLESHNTHLTTSEIRSAKLFQQQTSVEDKRTTWRTLVSQYGAYRAAYLIHLTEQEISEKSLVATEENVGQSFCFRCLPERLSFFLYEKNSTEPFKNAQGKIPSGKPIPQEGLVALGEGDEWLSDFELAIAKGMGIKIPFGTKTITEFDRIIVAGMQASDSPEKGAEHLLHGYMGFASDKNNNLYIANRVDKADVVITGKRDLVLGTPKVKAPVGGKMNNLQPVFLFIKYTFKQTANNKVAFKSTSIDHRHWTASVAGFSTGVADIGEHGAGTSMEVKMVKLKGKNNWHIQANLKTHDGHNKHNLADWTVQVMFVQNQFCKVDDDYDAADLTPTIPPITGIPNWNL